MTFAEKTCQLANHSNRNATGCRYTSLKQALSTLSHIHTHSSISSLSQISHTHAQLALSHVHTSLSYTHTALLHTQLTQTSFTHTNSSLDTQLSHTNTHISDSQAQLSLSLTSKRPWMSEEQEHTMWHTHVCICVPACVCLHVCVRERVCVSVYVCVSERENMFMYLRLRKICVIQI